MGHKDFVEQQQLLNFTALAWRWPGNFPFGTQVSKHSGDLQGKKRKKGKKKRVFWGVGWWLREGKRKETLGKGLEVIE